MESAEESDVFYIVFEARRVTLGENRARNPSVKDGLWHSTTAVKEPESRSIMEAYNLESLRL